LTAICRHYGRSSSRATPHPGPSFALIDGQDSRRASVLMVPLPLPKEEQALVGSPPIALLTSQQRRRAGRLCRLGRVVAASEVERGDRRGSSPPRPDRKPPRLLGNCRFGTRPAVAGSIELGKYLLSFMQGKRLSDGEDLGDDRMSVVQRGSSWIRASAGSGAEVVPFVVEIRGGGGPVCDGYTRQPTSSAAPASPHASARSWPMTSVARLAGHSADAASSRSIARARRRPRRSADGSQLSDRHGRDAGVTGAGDGEPERDRLDHLMAQRFERGCGKLDR
jgi:hypothetical protein